MTQAWHWIWATAAFVAELASLAALAVWGFSAGESLPTKLLLGIGTPVLAAVLWGLFAAPKAVVHVLVLVVVTKVVVHGAAVLALVATGHPWLAVALAVLALLGALLSGSPAELSRA